jgi:quinohemoprotein ethanol dehydrogenase
VLVFKLGANKNLPPLPAATPVVLDPPPDTAPATIVEAGKVLYHTYCSTCHGDAATGSGVLPDLRYSSDIKDAAAMDVVVRQGSRADRRMVAFKAEITPQDLESIRAYIVHRANQDKDAGGRR